jgi:uncharacterized protein YlxW (UPF0749 family)
LILMVCGGLFVTSATSSGGTDLRPGRYTSLAALVEEDSSAYAVLRDRATGLNRQVTALSAQLRDDEVDHYQRRIERLRDPAGLVKRQGPGVTVVLSDAPRDAIDAATGDVNRLLVHLQDIQAVVNALWAGGASAVTVQGQRIISTTGIKCEGNSVQLQGVPYPQPYVIAAIGAQVPMLAALNNNAYLTAYRADAADPQISVGWEVRLNPNITAPAYDGLLDLSYATALRDDSP